MEFEERCLAFIQYLKMKIQHESLSWQEVSDFALGIAKEIDRRRVRNEPCFLLERLYNEAIWLKCELKTGEQ